MCCYWNGYGTQCNHPAQGLTVVLRDVVAEIVDRAGLDAVVVADEPVE